MKLKNNVSFESVIRSFEELYNRSYNSLELAELKLCYDNQLPHTHIKAIIKALRQARAALQC